MLIHGDNLIGPMLRFRLSPIYSDLPDVRVVLDPDEQRDLRIYGFMARQVRDNTNEAILLHLCIQQNSLLLCGAQDSLAIYIPDVVLPGCYDQCKAKYLVLEFLRTQTIIIGTFKLEIGKISEAWEEQVHTLALLL